MCKYLFFRMLFVFVHEICIYESLESPTRPDPKTKFHRMGFSGYMMALDERSRPVSIWGTLRYSDVRERRKTTSLTLLPNEGAPVSAFGKRKRRGQAHFSRWVAAVDGFPAVWIYSRQQHTGKKHPSPSRKKPRTALAGVFLTKKTDPHPKRCTKGWKRAVFHPISHKVNVCKLLKNK